MGIPGLWNHLVGAKELYSVSELVLESFAKHGRGFRLGIDVSIWCFHVKVLNKIKDETHNMGVNGDLRCVYSRLIKFLAQGVLPVVVFDGTEPRWKRGKYVTDGPKAMEKNIQDLCDVLNIPWKKAPGEAEAELARMNQAGIIDAVLSDDVDTLVFGAKMVLRNKSATLSGNKAKANQESTPINTPREAGPDDFIVYHAQTIERELGLTAHDLLFIGLTSGGDYDPAGVVNWGPKNALALVKGGFSKSLFDIIRNQKNFNDAEALKKIEDWKKELANELTNNTSKLFARKAPVRGADFLKSTFPVSSVLLSYLEPVVTKDQVEINWNGSISVEKLMLYFERTFAFTGEYALKKLRTALPALFLYPIMTNTNSNIGLMLVAAIGDFKTILGVSNCRVHLSARKLITQTAKYDAIGQEDLKVWVPEVLISRDPGIKFMINERREKIERIALKKKDAEKAKQERAAARTRKSEEGEKAKEKRMSKRFETPAATPKKSAPTRQTFLSYLPSPPTRQSTKAPHLSFTAVELNPFVHPKTTIIDSSDSETLVVEKPTKKLTFTEEEKKTRLTQLMAEYDTQASNKMAAPGEKQVQTKLDMEKISSKRRIRKRTPSPSHDTEVLCVASSSDERQKMVSVASSSALKRPEKQKTANIIVISDSE